jgi:hypothetical protein
VVGFLLFLPHGEAGEGGQVSSALVKLEVKVGGGTVRGSAPIQSSRGDMERGLCSTVSPTESSCLKCMAGIEWNPLTLRNLAPQATRPRQRQAFTVWLFVFGMMV